MSSLSLIKGDGDIYFNMLGGGKLKIQCSVSENLEKFRQIDKASKEAGGILLGNIHKHSNIYTVNDISTPTNADRQSRFLFYRSKSHHDIAVKSWKESDGICLYLGLWHSHPEFNPTPSKVDIRDWTNALTNGEYEGNSLFFLILGIRNICCWQGVYSKGSISPAFYKLKNIYR